MRGAQWLCLARLGVRVMAAHWELEAMALTRLRGGAISILFLFYVIISIVLSGRGIILCVIHWYGLYIAFWGQIGGGL
jgi:hypothetical protein